MMQPAVAVDMGTLDLTHAEGEGVVLFTTGFFSGE
jgi:hypothetical protein